MNANARKISRFLLNAINKHVFPLDFSAAIGFFLSPRPWISFAVDSKIMCKPWRGGGMPDFPTQMWTNR
jgi:hypothetical protein